jgi:ACT domain-containing protein
MRAVVTVIGKDTVGILAKVSSICAEYNANIIEVTQSVLQELFCMIMLVDISKLNIEYAKLSSSLNELGKQMDISVHVMHEDLFNSMHRI